MKKILELPLLPLRDVVVYPQVVMPLFVGREKSIKAIEAAMQDGKQIVLVAQKSPTDDDPGFNEIYPVGTLATILQMLKLPDGTVKVLVEGEQRAWLQQAGVQGGYLLAEASVAVEKQPVTGPEAEVLRRVVLETFRVLAQNSKKIPAEFLSAADDIDDVEQLIDSIAAQLPVKLEQKQQILATESVSGRVELLLGMLDAELELLKVEKRIRGRVKKQMDRNQRDYYLNEQMKAIQKELGEDEHGHNEVESLKKRIV